MAKQTESGERAAPGAPKLHEIMALNQQALQAFMDASSTALRGWQAMNLTLMETARHRYQEGIAALQKVVKCQSPSEGRKGRSRKPGSIALPTSIPTVVTRVGNELMSTRGSATPSGDAVPARPLRDLVPDQGAA